MLRVKYTFGLVPLLTRRPLLLDINHCEAIGQDDGAALQSYNSKSQASFVLPNFGSKRLAGVDRRPETRRKFLNAIRISRADGID
jgi:hypothetical protein